MTLRSKILLIVGITLAAMFIVLHFATRIVLSGSILEIEDEIVRWNMERVTASLSNEMTALGATAEGYAAAGTQLSFLNPVENGLNLLAVFNSSGQVEFASSLGAGDGKETALPEGLAEHTGAGGYLLQHPDRGSKKGIVLLPGGPMLVASSPFETVMGEDLAPGTLIVGRYLDEAAVQRLAGSTSTSLSVRLFGDAKADADFQKAEASLAGGSAVFVNPLSEKVVAGYVVLQDIYRHPILVLRAEAPRTIYLQGRAVIKFFVLYLLIGGLIVGALTLLLLEGTMISRLRRLSVSVNGIAANGNLAVRIAMPGRDEVSRLAVTINRMLAEMQQFQGKLGASRERYRNLADELSSAYQQLMDIIEFLPDATFVIDREKKVIAWNRAIEEMTGVHKEEIIGRGDYAYSVPFYGTNRPILIDLVDADNKETERQYEFIDKQGRTLYAEEMVPSLSQGKGGYLWATASPLFDSNGCVVGAIESLRDITERKRAEEQLKYLSLHDSLTGLYNRNYFEQDMRRLEGGRFAPVGVILCDIDGLKLVNDTLGHEAGDRLLSAASIILKDSFRTGDMVARIGGDEFAVLLPNSQETVLETACGRIREAVVRYNEVNEQLPLSISIGYAIGNGPSISMVDLFKEADNNVYREKLHRSQSARSAIVATLMKAIEARDFITEGHADRLQRLVADVGHDIGLPGHRVADLRLLAQFHDIGKVGIPDRILFKSERLTPEEFTEMQRHCEIGYRIAQSSPDLMPIADWILKHHEWWNGMGYPLGLKGEVIPLECRLLAIADAFDAMTSDRSYRQAVSREEAVAELTKCAGNQFDPQLAQKFVQVIEHSRAGMGDRHHAR